MKHISPEELFAQARRLAKSSMEENINSVHWYPCGRAWVHIRPARGKFVSYLKENGIGRRDSYYGGYVVSAWDLTEIPGPMCQSMTLAEFICRPVIDLFKENGITASMGTWID